MKKPLFFLILSIFVFLLVALPAKGVCLPCQKASQTGNIFSDPGLSQPTNNFSPGQMVYVRVETVGRGEEKNELRVLDSGKEMIQTMSLARSGTGPYVYTASFPAPGSSGVYYLDIKIEGDGSSFASQRNINVSGENSEVSVSSTATPTLTPTPSPRLKSQVTPTKIPYKSSSPPATGDRSWWLVISDFFQRILSYLTVCLK